MAVTATEKCFNYNYWKEQLPPHSSPSKMSTNNFSFTQYVSLTPPPQQCLCHKLTIETPSVGPSKYQVHTLYFPKKLYPIKIGLPSAVVSSESKNKFTFRKESQSTSNKIGCKNKPLVSEPITQVFASKGLVEFREKRTSCTSLNSQANALTTISSHLSNKASK